MQPDATAILVAAGSGNRLGRALPKALAGVGGTPLVRRAADALCGVPGLEELVVVVPPGGDDAPFRAALSGIALPFALTDGGARRRDSVRAGLAAARRPLVLVHDAARPFATRAVAARVLEAARAHGAAVPAVPVVDTLARDADGRIGEFVDRAGVVAIQTPQGFERSLLLEAHDAAPDDWDAPDDGSLVERAGHAVRLVPGDPENMKVTWPEDLARANARAGVGADLRVGLGWDVHPLVDGRPFLLAGVELDAERGPSGHSDGDPLCHAIADALLGAACLGDIGTLFPDTDPLCKDLPGTRLLAGTVSRLAEAGWVPRQVDAVVIVDRPKLAPARDAIREALSGVLGIDADAISVKGKRTEGLGGMADGRGVGCRAIVQIARGAR